MSRSWRWPKNSACQPPGRGYTDESAAHRNYALIPLALLRSAAFAALTFTAAAAAAASPYTIERPPAWIDDLPVAAEAPVPTEKVSLGVYDLLVDRQTRVTESSEIGYYRVARRVLSRAGVDTASEVRVAFDPSFQRLRFHHLRVVRDGSAINVLQPANIRIIQQESELDQKIYDGTLTALVFLPDVRPGDLVDYGYSLDGANPILGGRFVGSLSLAYSVPVRHLRERLLWETGRPLRTKNHNTGVAPKVTRTSAGTAYTWESHDVAPIDLDANVPASFDPYPSVTLSEFASWNEVAVWAAAMFDAAGTGGGELDALVGRWMSESDDEARRILAAIHFVQDEIRYLGIEIGPNSHQPHSPADVLRQRFGDCKDKSLLLATALRRMGVDAHPALVNSWARESIDTWQPSPFAFDHVVVTYTRAGRRYWVDPTDAQQGGALETLAFPDYRRALIVDSGTAGFSRIPAPPLLDPTTVVEETYVVSDYEKPARLEVSTTYQGRDADTMRQLLAVTAPADVAKEYLNHYANDDPGIEAVEPPRIADDRGANRLVITESYTLPAFWKEKAREFWAWAIDDRIAVPPTPRRSMPLAVHHPVHVRHRQVIRLPHRFDVKPESETIATEAFRFTGATSLRGTTIQLDYTYRTLADAVPPGQASRHVEQLNRVRDQLGYGIWYERNAAAAAARGRRDPSWGWKAPAAVGGATLLAILAGAIGGWFAFGRGRATTTAGATPSTAIRVDGPVALARRTSMLRCACGTGYRYPLPQRNAVFNERRLVVVTAQCEHCGASRSVHFDLGSATVLQPVAPSLLRRVSEQPE